MRKELLYICLVSLIILNGCATQKKLIALEEKYGTDEPNKAIFHRMAEGDSGLGLRFPGYIIGIEKSDRQKLGLEKCGVWGRMFGCKDIDGIEKIDFHANKLYKKNVEKILNDHKRSFISHIVSYRANSSNNFSYIGDEFIFNAYDKKYEYESNIYDVSKKQIDKLKEHIKTDFKKNEYSHIFLYSMGWNTDQQESLRNFNSLIGMMQRQAGARAFNPLFIGITWPSEWDWGSEDVLGLSKLFSYPVKSQDADEVGMIWVNKLLRKVLVPLKTEHNVPLVLVGHSFGARLITRGVFGYADPLVEGHKPTDIDLVVGLEGAFSADRFMTIKESHEGAPYAEFKNYAQKFVFTWSEHDSANPVAFWTHFAGGKKVLHDANSKPYFSQFKLRVENGLDNDPPAADLDAHNSWDLKLTEVMDRKDLNAGKKWDAELKDPKTIAIVDASDLIRFEPYFKGGNAHSDIYTPGVAMFMWTMLDQLPQPAPNKSKVEGIK